MVKKNHGVEIAIIDTNQKHMQKDITQLKNDVSEVKNDVSEVKTDISAMKTDIRWLVLSIKKTNGNTGNTVKSIRNTNLKVWYKRPLVIVVGALVGLGVVISGASMFNSFSISAKFFDSSIKIKTMNKK